MWGQGLGPGLGVRVGGCLASRYPPWTCKSQFPIHARRRSPPQKSQWLRKAYANACLVVQAYMFTRMCACMCVIYGDISLVDTSFSSKADPKEAFEDHDSFRGATIAPGAQPVSLSQI